MNKMVLGILAHVDAGKTTLSEAILYNGKAIRNIGRVDRGDAFLDTDSLEKERGITIFSKQAVLATDDCKITLVDTPGHVDFSSEMERCLSVLDAAVLVVSGADGIDSHTALLWKLLEHYNVPALVFVNKMDQPGSDKNALFKQLRNKFGTGVVDFSTEDTNELNENIAMCDEVLLDRMLEGKEPDEKDIHSLIYSRKLFPVFWGSALKNEGVDKLLSFITGSVSKDWAGLETEKFGGKVFKITRDSKGERLTHVKVTSGSCRVKEILPGSEDKINQIRIYSGDKFETADQVVAGDVCAFTGLSDTKSGQCLGCENDRAGEPLMIPVQSHTLILPAEVSPLAFLPKVKILEDEDPTLHVSWGEKDRSIGISVMGEVGLEVIRHRIKERFDVDVSFGKGRVLYKETIAGPVEGIGHYEPLKHYSEVHLLMEPAEPGSGLVFDTDVSVDELDLNWQRLILTHLKEKEHLGVLTGSPITDMRITLVAGRAHLKHTEGGDFRQSTYRAVRQGLMKAENVLLEPVYDFSIILPTESVGRALTDLDRMQAKFSIESGEGIESGLSEIRGSAPVSEMANYSSTLASYTSGKGQLSCTVKGYSVCHNAEEVIGEIAYDAEADTDNTADSVFCAHGAGCLIPWYEVENYMHLPALNLDDEVEYESYEDELSMMAVEAFRVSGNRSSCDIAIGTDEIDDIIRQSVGANSGANKKGSVGYLKRRVRKPATVREYKESKPGSVKVAAPKPKYLLVDGYNVIFAWKELKELAEVNIDSARDRLMDIMSNYKAVKGVELILVFDAYKVRGGTEHAFDFHNIHIVYTREAQTADAYIERFAHENSKNYDITVVTSDGLEQLIIRGEGCLLISSREFEHEVENATRNLMEQFRNSNKN